MFRFRGCHSHFMRSCLFHCILKFIGDVCAPPLQSSISGQNHSCRTSSSQVVRSSCCPTLDAALVRQTTFLFGRGCPISCVVTFRRCVQRAVVFRRFRSERIRFSCDQALRESVPATHAPCTPYSMRRSVRVSDQRGDDDDAVL